MQPILRFGNERGQTILIVAISLLALLAIMALAIDITTLYVDRTQAQAAVDSAALAGAQAFVSSGFTSGNVNSITVQTLATDQAKLAGQQHSVAGAPVLAAELAVSFPQIGRGNPVISVVFNRASVPTYLARIWGVRSTSIKASASAEAYNQSGSTTTTPIQVSGVKPWLLGNCDPNNTTPANPSCRGSAAYFVDPTTGSIENSGSFIGQPIALQFAPSGGSGNNLAPGEYYPLDIPENPPTAFCAASSQTGCGNTPGIYYDAIACFNPTVFTCGESVNGPADSVWVDSRFHTGSLNPRTDQGTECLIHASGTGPAVIANDCGGSPIEQDCFVMAGAGNPVLITPGTANPDGSLAGASHISRSDSVVTVPLFSGSNLCPASGCKDIQNATPATIVGFLQLGIRATQGNGQLDAVILNVSGCNASPTGPAVSGGNLSPIPVRLVQTP